MFQVLFEGKKGKVKLGKTQLEGVVSNEECRTLVTFLNETRPILFGLSEI